MGMGMGMGMGDFEGGSLVQKYSPRLWGLYQKKEPSF